MVSLPNPAMVNKSMNRERGEAQRAAAVEDTRVRYSLRLNVPEALGGAAVSQSGSMRPKDIAKELRKQARMLETLEH